MSTFKLSNLMIVMSIFSFSACIVSQNPAPVTTGSTTDGEAIEQISTSEPYNPGNGGYVPASNPNNINPTTSSSGYVPSYAAVDINARQHTVVKGDTVYNISKRYQITQGELVSWNNLSDNTISVGQVLNVKNPSGTTTYTKPATTTEVTSSAPVNQPSSNTTTSSTASTTSNSAVKTVDGISWIKPVAGQLVSNYSSTTKGIDISAQNGSPVVAASDGKVIFSGSLEGYGNLVIVQHDTRYITAYANNKSNLVKEGEMVKRGQKLATMGTKNGKGQLHFELRKDGHAIDPSPYLPAF